MRKLITWTDSEIDFLFKNYPSVDTKIISEKINKSTSAVTKKAFDLKIKKENYIEWGDAETKLIELMYPKYKKSDIIHALPNRTWEKIKKKANSMNIKRNTKGMDMIMADLSILLEDLNIAGYWMGFLLADGHFSKVNRIKLSLNEIESQHLNKFGEFIKYCGKIKHYKKTKELSVMDNFNVKNIKTKFSITSTKTYTPPELQIFKNMRDDYFISALIGFIDGDGCIQNRKNTKFGSISVKCHKSWLEVLNYFIERLNSIGKFNIPMGKINNAGYARIFITNKIVAKFLFEKSKNLLLPVLERKWNKLKTII